MCLSSNNSEQRTINISTMKIHVRYLQKQHQVISQLKNSEGSPLRLHQHLFLKHAFKKKTHYGSRNLLKEGTID